MIIPMVCFSCGKPIAHLWEDYLKIVKHYQSGGAPNPPFIDRDHQCDPSLVKETPEFMALCHLRVSRECCRRMFLCQYDMYEKIR
jgi:DNA-directed RNA polymerase I, II, and III subunit RPABC5/DNA-directed RNA polymerase subunit N